MKQLGQKREVSVIDPEKIRQVRLEAVGQTIKEGKTSIESLPYPQYAITEEIREMLRQNGISLPGHYNEYHPDTTNQDYQPEQETSPKNEVGEVVANILAA